jgi:subtilisin family serine protease
MRIFKTGLAALAFFAFSQTQAQVKGATFSTGDTFPEKKAELTDAQLKRWSFMDLQKDTVPGMSVDKAYNEFLKGRKSTKVTVAVVDSGVDIAHEDLKSVIWTNPKEIAGNGKDDDKNGYIDDVHGWNFLGDAVNENYEFIRILKKGDNGSEAYKKAKQELAEKRSEMLSNKQQLDFVLKAKNAIDTKLGKTDYTFDEVKAIDPGTDATLSQSKFIVMSVMQQTGPNFAEEIGQFEKQVKDQLDYALNVDFDGRKVIGDNPDDIKDTKYGNNNVTGPIADEAFHGTLVSGIIASERGNGKGTDGIADNAQIMAIRAVPNGDEYDKDIALAIRYAVDNGAKVINGSFGKYFSPHKEWVADAIKYAASKDVLIVFASGNDAKDLDNNENRSYPSDAPDNNGEVADNVLTVGALNYVYGKQIIAPFSNFGKTYVDVYAPGVQIYGVKPGNKYTSSDGTSFASPNAAGVAALVRSYFPNLSAAQVKHIIMDSGTALSIDVEVGEKREKRPFSEVSKSGHLVNAYNALVMAEKMSKSMPAKKVKG